MQIGHRVSLLVANGSARQLAGPAVLAACEAWSARRSALVERIKVGDAISKLLAAKEKLREQGSRTYKSKLKPLGALYGQMFLDELTVAHWNRYLDRFEWSGVSVF